MKKLLYFYMLNFSMEIILLSFDKMKDITLKNSIFAKKKKKKTNTDIPKLTIPNYNQY